MALELVARSAVALSAHLNSLYRVLKGIDPDNVYLRLPTAGSFEVRHSATNAPVIRVTDAGIAGVIQGSQLVDGTVTSAKIEDGSIVNADVSSSAAIGLAKLAHVGANNVLRSNGTANVGSPIVTNDMVINTINADRLQNSSITASKLGTGITAPACAFLASSGVMATQQPSVTFSGISQAYTSLELRVFARSTVAALGETVRLQANGNAAAAYYNQTLFAQSSTTTSAEAVGAVSGDLGLIPGAAASLPSWMGTITVQLHGYATTGTFKTALTTCYGSWNTPVNNQQVSLRGTSMTGSTAAITSLLLFPAAGQFTAGSVVNLYGYV